MRLKSKVKTLQEAKNMFENLKTDEKSVLFSEGKLSLKLLKKLKKSSYVNEKKLLKLVNTA